jgi:hypothetical protein
VDGERVHIHYDDGDKEWTTAAALVVPCQAFGPDARPTKSVTRRNAAWGWVGTAAVVIVLLFVRLGCRH